MKSLKIYLRKGTLSCWVALDDLSAEFSRFTLELVTELLSNVTILLAGGGTFILIK